MVEHSDIRVVHRGGSKINFRAPVVTSDSKFLLCASGECVKLYSTTTEECIHELQGHTDLVTGVLLNPSNHLQVYSSSLDGTVRLWDFTDGILIKSYVVEHQIYAIYASADHKGVIFVVTPDQRNGSFQLVALHLPQSGDQLVVGLELSVVLQDVCASPESIAFGRGGEYITSVKGLHLVVYFFRKHKAFNFSLKQDNRKGGKNTFTCVACHPKDDVISTGHEDGKIRLWRNFNQKKEYTYSTLHWHHNAVSSLCFTPEGTNLLSGGVESVLVQWRYGQESQKDFLPRLGGAITHVTVSPDGSLFCTSHVDNKITIIQSCVKVSAVIQGLVQGESVATDLTVDPRSKALVLNGKPGHLQFYSLHRDKLLFNLDIVQQEYIHELGLQQFEVVKATFDASGKHLATVEERKQKAAEWELNLKLWRFDEQTQSFVLDTTISAPHEDRITTMCFGPTATDHHATTLVSASKDGHFKAWQQTVPTTHTEDEGPSWACDFVGSYHSLAPQCCSFSADGSLLAVSFREVVTVWSPATWELLTTLSQPPGSIRNLCFGQLSCSKYLLGTTEKNLLCCWNLLTCSLEWSTSMDVSLLLHDPLSENMAAFCSQDGCTDLFVFKPCEPRPLFCQKAVCPGKVTRAVFSPREAMQESCDESCQWLNRSQLYFLSQHMELKTFITKAEEKRLMGSNKQLAIDDTVAMTPFHLLLGQQRQEVDNLGPTDNPAMAERLQLQQSSAAIKELLQTPAHVLPSATFLCSMFVQSLLISVTDSSKPKHTEEEMESEKEEEGSSDEEEMETGAVMAKRLALEEGKTAGPAAPALTRTQARELKRVKKLERSWLSTLLDC
ncbi:WD repeat-containing protein 75 [Corythoichthys intestinalis]|uniref:WD repeat-containing protein 75 n=1 Tax=Corythoichthys intestinalis TaxID=161448 RepID=UPI0025A588D1|nr:WD repeat-containing protein 75 [Corythoichthys intestinalis]XP_061799578.1 WD repeat-containing protein 75-like [Nerophis lumbriciformis]